MKVNYILTIWFLSIILNLSATPSDNLYDECEYYKKTVLHFKQLLPKAKINFQAGTTKYFSSADQFEKIDTEKFNKNLLKCLGYLNEYKEYDYIIKLFPLKNDTIEAQILMRKYERFNIWEDGDSIKIFVDELPGVLYPTNIIFENKEIIEFNSNNVDFKVDLSKDSVKINEDKNFIKWIVENKVKPDTIFLNTNHIKK